MVGFGSVRRLASPWVSTKFGGLAAALGGVLFVLWGYIHGGTASPHFAAFTRVLAFLVPFLFLIALVGLHTRCTRLIGWFAGAGFTIGYLGSAWGGLQSFVDISFWYGYLAQRGWLLLPLSWLPWLFASLMMIGISFARMEILRGYSILLLVMGLLGWAYYFTDTTAGIFGVRLGHVVFGLLFGLGWIILGYALWSDQAEHLDQPRIRTEGVRSSHSLIRFRWPWTRY